MSSVPTRNSRSSRAVQPLRAHSRRKGQAKTFGGQRQPKRLLNREARQSRIKGSRHGKGQPSVSGRRQGQARKTFREVRERRRSHGRGKGTRKTAGKVRNEVRNAISNTGQPCIFTLTADPARNPPGSRSSPGEGEASMNIRPGIRMLRRFPHFLPARGLSESGSRLD